MSGPEAGGERGAGAHHQPARELARRRWRLEHLIVQGRLGGEPATTEERPGDHQRVGGGIGEGDAEVPAGERQRCGGNQRQRQDPEQTGGACHAPRGLSAGLAPLLEPRRGVAQPALDRRPACPSVLGRGVQRLARQRTQPVAPVARRSPMRAGGHCGLPVSGGAERLPGGDPDGRQQNRRAEKAAHPRRHRTTPHCSPARAGRLHTIARAAIVPHGRDPLHRPASTRRRAATAAEA